MMTKRRAILAASAAATSAVLTFGIATATAEQEHALVAMKPAELFGQKPAAATTTAKPSTTSSTTATPQKPSAADPLNGVTFYGPNNKGAIETAAAWKSSRPADAAHMQYIADTPAAKWLGGWSGDPKTAVNAEVTAATAAGKVPVLVAYNIPGRDCGQYSAGGVATEAEYKTWIDGVAAGIASRKAVVIIEPDALAHMCGDTAARYRMLNYAVDVMAKQTGAITYIDAGHAAWLAPAEAASRLKQAGIAKARGFSINVSNFIKTDESVKYGDQIATLTNSHYIVDTSRNANGPASDWCNPPGRGLGVAPTSKTASEKADAYVWVKTAGESDGACNGAPAAGVFMPDYALALAKNRAVVGG
jgi:endoglucanase